MGSNIEFKSLRSLRQIWDKAVAKTKGFQKHLSDLDRIDIKKETVNAIRDVLAKERPELAPLNTEFHIWKTTEEVLFETMRRTRGRGTPLGQQIARGAGGAAGFGAAGVEGAISGAFISQQFIRVINSPGWRLVSAKMKTQLAEFIVDGNIKEFNRALTALEATDIYGDIGEEAREVTP